MQPTNAVIADHSGRSACELGLQAWEFRGLSTVAGAVLLLLTTPALWAQSPVEQPPLFANAQVWRPTNIASMNLRMGEPGPGAFAPNETVRCEYLNDDLAGRSPKFRCRMAPDEDVRVKFGVDNGEVYAEVAATRLLWALGFGADRVYPVRVICRGCPNTVGQPGASGERVVQAATIERKAGIELAGQDGGWPWGALDLIDERVGGAPRAQRDALKLLAVFLQHTDTKPEQQRLLCLDSVPDAGRSCAHTLMMLDDVGLTFGRATLLNSNAISSMNHREWASVPVWKYATTCIGNLPRSLTGTLRDPAISEEGRQFLGRLLLQLSDLQLRDLFEVARAERREARPNDRSGTATVDQWVDTFKQKRAAIVDRRCADEWSSRAPALFSTTPNLWLQARGSPRLTAGMSLVSLFGYTPFYVALTLLLAFTVNIRAGASLLVLLVLTNVLTTATKTVVSYPRPDAVDTRIRPGAAGSNGNMEVARYVPAPAQDLVERFVALPSAMGTDEAYGFPSGHVAVAMAFVGGLVFLYGWRGAWIAALLWVPLMAVSRMYLGRHFLGDVVGGVAAGVVAIAVVVRALNLQRLRHRADRRVLVKTLATAFACAGLALAAAIPPVYDAGRLVGAAVALALVCYGASAGYDEESRVVRAGRLAAAVACSVMVWWVTTTALHAYGEEPSATLAFLIGAVRIGALMPAPVLIEAAFRRKGWSK